MDNDIDRKNLAMDILSGSMYSINFLRDISVVIFDQRVKDMTVREFHAAWSSKVNYTDHIVPYCLGSIIGYLYCGILLGKEHWHHLLPEESINQCSVDWGFSRIAYDSPKRINPSIKYAVRRMRNALGHGNIKIHVPRDLDISKDKLDFENRSTITFSDINPYDSTDIFEITVSIIELSMFVRKYQSIAYQDINNSTYKSEQN